MKLTKLMNILPGQVGPGNDTEFEVGKDMGAYYKEQGVSKVAIYGAFIPNPMHVYRVALVSLTDWVAPMAEKAI